MMNLSKIEWCDLSWNPVTGCYHDCEYCYAKSLARRFQGDVRLNVGCAEIECIQRRPTLYVQGAPFKTPEGHSTQFPTGFAPTLHEYRLGNPVQRKKPANIFVCSMADLFGSWVPDEWISRVFAACETAPWHNYLFLTKNPGRYQELYQKGILPTGDRAKNMWFGSTVTTEEDKFFWSFEHNAFLSVEPIHGPMEVQTNPQQLGILGIRWLIVGAETGRRRGKVTPKREWIETLVESARQNNIQILLKDSAEMRAVWGDDLISEYPEEIARIHETYSAKKENTT